MAKYKIKKDDTVVVTAGNHKGATGRVLQVLTDEDRVLVEKVNLVKRQVKSAGERMGGKSEDAVRMMLRRAEAKLAERLSRTLGEES